MSDSAWDGLSQIEYDLIICAMEASGILPNSWSASEDSEAPVPSDVVAAVLSLVDRGWVEVRRFEPWTAPDGSEGETHGEPIARDEIPAVLADPDTWDEPDVRSWAGEVTLTLTEAWKRAATG